MATSSAFSIRDTFVKYYPSIEQDQGVDINKNGVIDETERLPDVNGNGIYDDEDYWSFFNNHRDSFEIVKIDFLTYFSNREKETASCLRENVDDLIAFNGIETLHYLVDSLHECYEYGKNSALEDAIVNSGEKAVPELLKKLTARLASFSRKEEMALESKEIALIVRIGEDAVPSLVSLFKRGSRDISDLVVAVALRQLGSVAVPALIEAFRGALSQEKRNQFVLLFSEIKDPRLIPILVGTIVMTTNDQDIHLWALAIANQGEEAISPLFAAFRDEKPKVRAGAITIAGKMLGFKPRDGVPVLEGSRVVPELKTVLETETDPAVRQAAFDTLSRSGDAAIPVLMDLLNNPNAELRLAVVDALGKMKEKGQPAMIMALKDPDPKVKTRAAQGLQATPMPFAVPNLMAALKEDDDKTREAVALALAACLPKGNENENTLLNELHNDNDPRVLEGVIIAIRERNKNTSPFFNMDILPKLIGLFGHEDPNVRVEAARAVGVLGDSNGLGCPAELVAAFEQGDTNTRIAVLSVMVHWPFEGFALRLKEAITDSDNKVRLKAFITIKFLLEHKESCARNMGASHLIVDIIQRLQNEPDQNVQKVAADDLFSFAMRFEKADYRIAQTDAIQSLPLLIGLLKHDNPLIRCSAAFTLGRAKDTRAIPALRPLLNDPDEEVRINAQAALRNLGFTGQ